MPRSLTTAALAIFGFAAVAISSQEASAHGWHGHRHHHYHHRHHRGWVHHYGPRYRWVSISPFAWNYGCGLRRFVTRYGALAYREVCY